MISVVDPEVMTQSDRSLVNTSIELALSSTHVRHILTIASIESGRCDVEGYTPLTVTLNIIWCGAISIHLPLPSNFHFHPPSTSIKLPFPSTFHFHQTSNHITFLENLQTLVISQLFVHRHNIFLITHLHSHEYKIHNFSICHIHLCATKSLHPKIISVNISAYNESMHLLLSYKSFSLADGSFLVLHSLDQLLISSA